MAGSPFTLPTRRRNANALGLYFTCLGTACIHWITKQHLKAVFHRQNVV